MSAPSPLTVLRGARELLSDPDRWCREDYAQDEGGGQVDPLEKDARRWCLVGAVEHVIGRRGLPTCAVIDLLRDALIELHPGSEPTVLGFNDRHEHRDVLRLIDKAIEIAGEV